MMMMQPAGILMMVQPEHESGAGGGHARPAGTRIQLAAPRHRVQFGRRQRKRRPRGRRRIAAASACAAALRRCALVGPRLEAFTLSHCANNKHTRARLQNLEIKISIRW